VLANAPLKTAMKHPEYSTCQTINPQPTSHQKYSDELRWRFPKAARGPAPTTLVESMLQEYEAIRAQEIALVCTCPVNQQVGRTDDSAESIAKSRKSNQFHFCGVVWIKRH